MTLPSGLAALPIGLLAAATLALALLRAIPRPDAPVLLLLPPGAAAGQGLAGVLGLPPWRLRDLGRLGPFPTLRVVPAEPGASLAALGQASGAWLILAAPATAGCAPAAAIPQGSRR